MLPIIETDSLVPILSKHKGDFSVLSLNIQSINSKYDALLAVLSDLNENNIKIDAICFQETWLSYDHDVAMFNIPGYQLISQGHSCITHSGLIIFLADSYSYLIKSIHRGSQLGDALFIEVTGESLRDKIVIENLYRPPRFNNNNETIKQFCQEPAPIISSISKSSFHVIIAGDFNIDLLHINEQSVFQKYFDLFVTHGFSPKLLYQHDVVNPVLPLFTKCFANSKILTNTCLLVWKILHIGSFSVSIYFWHLEEN